MKNIVRALLVAALLANTIPTTARADVIRDWNQNMLTRHSCRRPLTRS